MQYSLALLLLVAVAVRAAHWGGDGCTWATTDVKTAYGVRPITFLYAYCLIDFSLVWVR